MNEESNKLKLRVKKLLSIQSTIRTTINTINLRHPNRQTEVSVQDLITFGNRISTTLHAPRHWKPGAMLISAYPPAPQADNMRKGILGNIKVNVVTSNQSNELLKQIQEEIQLTAKASYSNRTSSLLSTLLPSSSSSNVNNLNHQTNQTDSKRPAPFSSSSSSNSAEPPPPDLPSKKQRTININFGFESDSESD